MPTPAAIKIILFAFALVEAREFLLWQVPGHLVFAAEPEFFYAQLQNG
jgi:hypothetical protein